MQPKDGMPISMQIWSHLSSSIMQRFPNEIERIQEASPHNFIWGGWLPQNQLTMVIIHPSHPLPSTLSLLPPIYYCKEETLMKLLCIILVLILVFYLKQRLTILDGKLCHHCACRKTLPCCIMSYWETWERIPQFFSCPFSILWRALTLPCIAHFSTGFPTFWRQGCPSYPLLALTCSPGSRKWCNTFLNILISMHLPMW